MPNANFPIKPAVFLLAVLLFLPLPSFAVEYCVDLSAFGRFGAMSFDVTTDDSAGTATITVVAGYARGWELAGSWDPTSLSGGVGVRIWQKVDTSPARTVDDKLVASNRSSVVLPGIEPATS